uniref:Ground-like domain-containing protein n=1 Tax=Rhabditophanes sp. KR3021 TaxID=114890 RepID=A0AC35UFP2_9BILA
MKFILIIASTCIFGALAQYGGGSPCCANRYGCGMMQSSGCGGGYSLPQPVFQPQPTFCPPQMPCPKINCPLPPPCPPTFCPPPPMPMPCPPEKFCPPPPLPMPCNCPRLPPPMPMPTGGCSVMPSPFGQPSGCGGLPQFPPLQPLPMPQFPPLQPLPMPQMPPGGMGCGGRGSAPYPFQGGCGSPRPNFFPPPQNDCCCNCASSCAFNVHRSHLRSAFGTRTFNAPQDPKCNTKELKTIISKYISSDLATSKRLIQKNAQETLLKKYDVICGTGEFSFIIHTDSFCQHSVDNVTCYVFHPSV